MTESSSTSMPAGIDALDHFRLDGRVAILTGASSGLGHRFAQVLTGSGAAVVLAARRADRLAELTDELNANGKGPAVAVACDLTDAGAPDALVAAALDHFGQVDVVVNNAGISRVLPAVDDDVDEFRRELEINLVAPYELARKAGKWMLDNERPGSVVNIGSILGTVGGGRLKVPGYAAAKGGLHNLTRELASEWARKGVRCNTIAPGWFETEMNSNMFGSDGGMSYINEGAAMGRPGYEGELDGALLFLASNASSYVTGQILHVDGGWTAV